MTPQAAKLIDHALTTHARRVTATGRLDSIKRAGEANSAQAALVAYIEDLEARAARKSRGQEILDLLADGPRRLTILAESMGCTLKVASVVLNRLCGEGRVVCLARGVYGLPGARLEDLSKDNLKARRFGQGADVVLGYLRSRGCAVHSHEIANHLRAQGEKADSQVVWQALAKLEARGEVERIERGVWKARTATTA